MAAQRMSYPRAVQWIAYNDEPGDRDVQSVSELISVVLVADLTGKAPEQVARDVIKARPRDL